MFSALESFNMIPSDKKLVILGDMLELGQKAEEEHIKILDELQTHKIEKAFLVGPVFQKVSSKYGFKSFNDVNRLMDFLKSEPLKGNTILIKGSRGIGLEKIYDLL
jgi:UDP-N-acetylmuramoyl-tripeptide--D-alanyl-D-alanine ligase